MIVGDRMPVNLMRGDCLELMRQIPDKSVDLILCDPPFGTTSIAWDQIIPFDKLWEAYRRIITDNGTIILFGSQPFTSHVVLSNEEWFRYELIWDKNKCGSPGLAKIRPMKTHENILVFSPSSGKKSTYNPIMTEGTPYSRKLSGNTRCNTHGYGFKNEGVIENTGTRYPKSIVQISRDFSAQQQVHPTQKPVPLLEWLVTTYSNRGEIVLDNCMGSGSTGVAAVRLGRKFIGIEMSDEYFEIAETAIMREVNSFGDCF